VLGALGFGVSVRLDAGSVDHAPEKSSKLFAVHSRFGESLTGLKLWSGPISRDSMVKVVVPSAQSTRG
jgi:hypothetical protein